MYIHTHTPFVWNGHALVSGHRTKGLGRCKEMLLPEARLVQGSHVFHLECGYPLVDIQKAIENGHRNSGFTHEYSSMVIFHSYVCLPEGKTIINHPPNHHK